MRIIAGKWRSRIIDAPPGFKTRPTTDRVREAWMSMLQPELPGSRVLDLFSGSGALGLETLSRGAEHVTFVEKAPAALKVLKGNIDKLDAAAEVEIVKADALRFIEMLEPMAYDLALADPPYEGGWAEQLARSFLARPFAASLWIEHDVKETFNGLEITRTRRYGDTAITEIQAPE